MKLKFGTGGLRATMAPGPEHLNIETIREATLGVASYAKLLSKEPTVAIAYDSRKNSEIFAKETARVLAASGCTVFLYPQLMPTPALSFAVRSLSCDLGIVITASHNPKEYNGYKVYGSDGCQITSKAAEKIQQEIEKAEIEKTAEMESFEQLLGKGKIAWISSRMKEKFLEEILKLRTCQSQEEDLKVVYTPLNGAGAECVSDILKKIGIRELFMVPEQRDPDGEFPTCPYPNPEEDDALILGLELCRERDADLLLATDPDSDRVGVAAKKDGAYQRFTGNQVGILMLDHLLKKHKQEGTMPQHPVIIKTIVTTSMAEKIAEQYGAEIIDTLTGFKYIGEQIGNLEYSGNLEDFVFGFEESCGYLIGPYVRDKDAVGAAMLICEMAGEYKKQGKTLWDVMEELYQIYGYYETELKTFHFEAADAKIYMEDLREHLQTGYVGLYSSKIVKYQDYLEGINGLPKSDVVKLWFEDGTRIVVRPSGTEPKIKIYIESEKR